MQFREVVRPPLWLLSITYFFFLSLVLSVWAALGNNAALISLFALTLLLLMIYIKGALVIEVDENELRAGRAHIERKFIGSVLFHDAESSKKLRTRDADPAAFLAIRFWQPQSVQVFLDDPRDKTPYWVITSKKSKKLVEALALKN